jgi:hypothetical protein
MTSLLSKEFLFQLKISNKSVFKCCFDTEKHLRYLYVYIICKISHFLAIVYKVDAKIQSLKVILNVSSLDLIKTVSVINDFCFALCALLEEEVSLLHTLQQF